MRLKDKIALVTGASQGIGRVIACRMAAEGARVVLTARNEPNLQKTSKLIAAAGGSSLVIPADLADKKSLVNLIEKTLAEWGAIDILVNNSGIIGPTKRCEEISRQEWDECMSVNMTGVFLLTQAALPAMKKNRSGTIINVGSVTGKRPLPGRMPYAAAKMALVGFTRTLAFEVGDFGITANVICPGSTEGPRIDRVCREMAIAEKISIEDAATTFTAPAALKRFVLPEDHAGICVFLASDDGANVTGQDINVSGGLVWY
ncbi:MAG: SDR family oxidoreductase [Nitrospinaceae bacterium]|nr:SDR family oxidoreductase [Nitrospinaceae bacterium]MBT4095101.1 SDR family oxidoreductase [Nitrospinaceae bacterium]MBT5946586.1 SDR family oxidoreductase [Nitrospinaceae bacterium]MBT6394362.1 SDR family oxidoreductase [Nitrospinaceae bacterium]MBT7857774.1 SDR family oxidoreductase [Nitrospinaceae bacterium]